MLSSKKSKDQQSGIRDQGSGILAFPLSLFFAIVIVIGHFSTPALAQLNSPDVAGTGLSTASLVDTALSVINAFLALVGIIALGIFVYGGYLWMTSGGNPKKIALAKKVLISAVIGLIIILLSWAIVSFIFNAVDGGGGGGGDDEPPPFTESSYVFKVIDYAPKGQDIPICRAIQATFDREYQSGSISDNFHLMKYCIDDAQCAGIGLGNCNRVFAAFAGKTFCANDIAGTFDYSDSNNVGFKPTNELEKMTDYKVLIDGGASGVQSQSGADCVGANDVCKDWDFKTGDLSDNIPPKVLKVSPPDLADNVCRLKTIAAQFTEEMYKPSLTKPQAFSMTSGGSVPAFSPSAPTFDILRESPKSPHDQNTDYYPLLNADTIMDACWNKLSGDGDDLAEGSPIDDYGDPLPDEANPNWKFTTGETTQCVPKINNIAPNPAYYEPADDTLSITGENFDDIADTVLFSRNLPISFGTQACFNNTYDQTNQFCLNSWDGASIPNKITAKVPAGEGDSNGAITGPLKVQVGQFQCAGPTTYCKGGTNKGLTCTEANEATDCPGSLCGDTGSCDGGSNAGNGCDSNSECPGSVSEAYDLTISSPHINNSISPKIGGPGAWITISGTQFGTTAGTVRVQNPFDNSWVDAGLPCANSWSDNYIIIEIPTNFPTNGIVNIQVIASTDSRHSNINSDFALNASAPNPGICAIAPDCGPTGTSVAIGGKRFGTTGSVFFGDAAATTSFWIDTQITATSPTQPADGAYPVKVTVNSLDSNTLPFSTICSGRPKVVESLTCGNTTQSPSPYKNTTGNPDAANDACINTSAISARFNMDMDETMISDNNNVKLYKCTGYQAGCTAEITPTGIDILNLDTNSEGFKFNLPGGEPVQNGWYQGWISRDVKSELGTTMGTVPADDYRWDFHIADSATACPVDSVSLNPPVATVADGTTVYYTAVPQSANCNFIGACTDYVYNWSTSGTPMPHSSIPIPSNTCNVSVSADSVTPIDTPDTITASVQSIMGAAQLTITSGSGGAVCGNNTVEIGEQCDGETDCTLDCKLIPSILSVVPNNGATNVCKNAAVEIAFSTLMSGATLNANTVRLMDTTAEPDVQIVGSISIKNTADKTTVVFYPSAVLSNTTDYAVEVVGGASGVKSSKGVELSQSCGGVMAWNADRCVSTFTTGTEICKIDKVSIILEKDFNSDSSVYDPKSYIGPDLFTCAGKDGCPDDFNTVADGQNQHNAKAEAKDATGLTLGGVAYSWTKSTDAPFEILSPDANTTLVEADPKSGIGALTVKADGGAAGIKTASTTVTVEPCDNPWPPAPNLNVTYPFQDNGANPTNFSLWYCRDAGAAGTADDLPALNIISKVGAGELVKEFFFYDAANPNDAVGMRVYQNYDDAISNKKNHWSAREWYEKRAPNKLGAPASTTVDGWEGVQAGRSIYVNAANHLDANKPKTHIYLMSHSDKVSAGLQNIYGQLKSNWKFAITEYDDGTDGTASGAPQNHLRKLQRDTKRTSDLYDAAVDLYQSKIIKGKYPLLPAGSYLNGHSTSVWPSWDGTLSKEVGASMPHDPISQMSSLVGWWKLDEGSGNVMGDDGPYGKDGSPQNFSDPYGWRIGSQCEFGNCMELDGTDDYIDVGSFSGLYSNKLTVSAWIKTKPNGGWDDIVAGGCGNFIFAIFDGKLDFEDQCGKGDNLGTDMEPLQSKKKIDDDKWHFVAATYDGLVAKLYIDGIFESSGPANGDFDATNGSLYIGSTSNGGENFDGSIDEVRIWNAPLSDAEISNLFKSNAAKFGSSEDSGWDQTKNAFFCDAGADFDTHIYHYNYELNGADFSLYAALEYVGGDSSTWRQKTIADPYNPCDGVGLSSCSCYNYRQQQVDASNLGTCNNGQWDPLLGEQCDGSVDAPALNGLENRTCSKGKCVGGSNDGADCTNNLQCPGGTCVPEDPQCDPACKAFCPSGPIQKAECGNAFVESPTETCDCSDFGNPATCVTAEGAAMSDYYCWNDNGNNDLDNLDNVIDDQFTSDVTCAPKGPDNECNLVCAGKSVLAEVGNAYYEPWVEQCEPKRGYCSATNASCAINIVNGSDDCAPSTGPCIALGMGGYYCDDGSAAICKDGTRSCTTGTLTSCIGGDEQLAQCGADKLPTEDPYNYLDYDLWGWCFR